MKTRKTGTQNSTYSAELSHKRDSISKTGFLEVPLRESIDMILDYARSTGSVIQLHTGSGKSHVRLVEKLVRYAGKEVRFHLVHMGGNVDAHFYLIPRLLEWREEGLNIVCDTSWSGGFALRWLLDLASENPLLGSCIMFASDEPWGIFQAELAKVLDAADGKPDLLEAVLWSNAARIYSRQSPT
ncbi:MAG: amidohydrolase family protein [Nitrospirae bacterium]|nr:amidohydrolase family protein [Nitrospirota bacterium]